METKAIQIIPELLELLRKDGVSVPKELTQSKSTTACDNKKQKQKIKKIKKAKNKTNHAIDDNHAQTTDPDDYEQEERLLLQAMQGEKPFTNAVLKSFYRNKHGRILLATINYDTTRLLHLIEDAVEASANPDDLIAYENAKAIAILIDRALHRLPFYSDDWRTLADKYGEQGLETHLIPQADYAAKRAVVLIKLTNTTQAITDDTYNTPFDDTLTPATATPTTIDHIKATVYTALYGNLNRMIYLTLKHTFKKYEQNSGIKRVGARVVAKKPSECVWVTEHSISHGYDGSNATLLATIQSPYTAEDLINLRQRQYIEQLQDEAIAQVKSMLKKAKKAGLSAYKKKKEIEYIKEMYELKLNAVNYLR